MKSESDFKQKTSQGHFFGHTVLFIILAQRNVAEILLLLGVTLSFCLQFCFPRKIAAYQFNLRARYD